MPARLKAGVSVSGPHPRRRPVVSTGPEVEQGNAVRFEVFTAAAMKNAVFWDIRTQFAPHRKNITCPLQSPAG
jgi:hypothetical protein